MAIKLGTNIQLDKVVRSLGEKYKLVPHLDMALATEDFSWEFEYKPKQADDAWHPSGDCTPTLRDLYLKATNETKEEAIGPGLRKIFMVGHFYHQYLQWVVQHRLQFAGADAIERRGYTWWGDVRDAPQPGGRLDITPLPYHWATGSADICPCEIPGEGDFLVDFKTVNPRMYAGGVRPEYLEKWECQGNIYMDFFNMDRALFVLIDKSSGDMKELEYRRNQPLIDAIYLKWKIVAECLTDCVEPPAAEQVSLPLQGAAT